MDERANEIQFGLDTFEPDQDQMTTLMFLGGAQDSFMWIIPVRPTLRHWKANQYNLSFTGLPLIDDGFAPKPLGRLQIAVYRSIKTLYPTPVGINVAELVPGSLYDSGTLGVPTTITVPDFDETVFALGGSYWIVIKVDDITPSGINKYQWGYWGWTVSDANLYHTIFQNTAVLPGNLPTLLNNLNWAPGSNYPYVRADYV